MNTAAKPYRFLNRDMIKYIAIIAMVFDHIGNTFMMMLLEHASFLNFCLSVGSFTAVVMIFFLVEGYGYTHSKKKYITRLLIFAVISQIPFMIAFAEEGIMAFDDLNMLFTICICFVILCILDTKWNAGLKVLLIIGCVLVTKFFDWPYLAPIYTLLFAWARKSDKRKIVAWLLSFLAFGIFQYIGNLKAQVSVGHNLYTVFTSGLGMIAAFVCIIFFYNGKRMEKGRTFSKWFFYIFYPAHLVVIGIIRIVLMG